jgi:hypothetical protein
LGSLNFPTKDVQPVDYSAWTAAMVGAIGRTASAFLTSVLDDAAVG